MRRDRFVHDFVEYVPSDPKEGVIYVSIPFRTVVHKCACGCGTKIATPLSPANWKMTYDGDTISLSGVDAPAAVVGLSVTMAGIGPA